ncbi:MAG TPA: tetratricopeptide repeat protein [Anaerolineales bacterium]|nr:tetratricopeptide repeat protein [Anaerolineales bacterium]
MPDALSPKQLTTEGKDAYQRKDYRAAAQAFQAAAIGFESLGDQLSAAEMMNNSSVAWLQSGDGVAALAAVVGTEIIFGQAGDIRRQAMAISNQAAALEALGRYDESANAYAKSADLFKDLGEMDLRAVVLRSLSAVQLRLGRQLEALASMQAGLDGVQKPTPKQKLVKKLLKSPFSVLGR